MKHTIKKLPESIVEVEVILDHKEFIDIYKPIFDRAMDNVQVKGFRPGTAPKEMAGAGVDNDKVFHEAANEAVRINLKKLTEENDWQFIDQPRVEVLESKTGLKFKAILALFPEVKLGNYQKIAKKIMADKKESSIDDEEVSRAIDWVLNSRAKLTRVDREVKKGDAVNINFHGTIDGKDLEGASHKEDQFVLGQGKFVPGFEENIIGHKEKDEFEFFVNFPKDYWKEDLRDKKIDFKVKVNGVFKRETPKLDDEFVKSLGKFENVEAFKKNVKEGLTQEKDQKENQKLRLKIIDEIIKNSKIETPKVMVDRTLDKMVHEYQTYTQKLPEKERKDESVVREELLDKAKNNVATNLVLYQIAKEQNIEPTKEEIDIEVSTFLAHSGQANNQNIDKNQLYDYVYGELKNRKVFEYLNLLK